MEYWQNCEENELRPMNSWITTSTATITGQLLSESPLPAAQQGNNKLISNCSFNKSSKSLETDVQQDTGTCSYIKHVNTSQTQSENITSSRLLTVQGCSETLLRMTVSRHLHHM